ncbi:LAETG motif-containing sortase-dependent surface protein [Streptomyces sp. 11x1]|uniref:LAETG motif-containing sortase-dependent surface protein n=1 Tax=Streptomyces sp. 11x1 TaxID=3038642 RepID=UPI00292E7B0A|nr:LAETG motif-containing sortase-dependent surface protein [Streptomyces sp. 11x1]WNZ08365.1 LAETG motif-containing sortase-dependent surface protein [Streptomyces sp. 11x1]
MSISPRSARTSRSIGVAFAAAALVLGVAGNAMASTIKDFSAVAECEGDTGVIRVTDVDPLGVKAEISVYLENNGADLRMVGSRTIVDSTAKGVTVTFDEDWEPNAEYRIHVEAEDYVDEDLPILVAPAEACTAEAITPPAAEKAPKKPSTDEKTDKDKNKDNGKDEDKETGKETDEDEGEPSRTKTSPTASESEGTATAGSDGDNAPSPEGDSDLAETGAESNTGTIAGAAAALVALGAGAVYYSMRRRGASTR